MAKSRASLFCTMDCRPRTWGGPIWQPLSLCFCSLPIAVSIGFIAICTTPSCTSTCTRYNQSITRYLLTHLYCYGFILPCSLITSGSVSIIQYAFLTFGLLITFQTVPTPYASHAFHPLDGYAQSVPYHLFVYLFPMQKWLYIAMFIFVNFWTVMIHDGKKRKN